MLEGSKLVGKMKVRILTLNLLSQNRTYVGTDSKGANNYFGYVGLSEQMARKQGPYM